MLAVAVLPGFTVAMELAMLGHEVPVLGYGEDFAPIADAPPMFAAVAFAHLAGH